MYSYEGCSLHTILSRKLGGSMTPMSASKMKLLGEEGKHECGGIGMIGERHTGCHRIANYSACFFGVAFLQPCTVRVCIK